MLIGICSSCEFKFQADKISDNKIVSVPKYITNVFPEKNGFVNDFENIFNDKQKTELKTIVDNYENKFGREIYIVTTSETYGFENYDALLSEFFQRWEIGKMPEQNGTLILLSKENRKFAISAGLEAQKYITDEKINDIIGRKVIPKLKENNFFGGTKIAVDEIIKMWE